MRLEQNDDYSVPKIFQLGGRHGHSVQYDRELQRLDARKVAIWFLAERIEVGPWQSQCCQ